MITKNNCSLNLLIGYSSTATDHQSQHQKFHAHTISMLQLHMATA